MKIRSLRQRLLIWNVAVLALCLFFAGYVTHFIVASDLMSQTDAQLLSGSQMSAGVALVMLSSDAKSEREADSVIQKFHHEMRMRQGSASGTAAGRTGPGNSTRIFDAKAKPLLASLTGSTSATLPYDPESMRIAESGSTDYRTIFVDSKRYRLISMPVKKGGSMPFVVQTILSEESMTVALEHLDKVLMHLIPFAILLAGAGGFLISAVALRPVSKMISSASNISAENLAHRLPIQSDRELAELGGAFNQVLERLEASFAAQQRFIADASHELRTPLAALKVNTSVALTGAPSIEEYRTALSCADRAADRMARLVNDLLFLSRSEADQLRPELTEVNCGRVMESVVQAFEGLAEQAGVLLNVDAPEEIVVPGDEQLIERLLSNLVANALAASSAGGEVSLSARNNNDSTELKVTDTGRGIAPEHLPHVFERFYRGDASRTQAGGGSGLGLSICRSIAESLGGSVMISSELDLGTEVTIRLVTAKF